MSEELRQTVQDGLKELAGTRLTGVLSCLQLAGSSWYRAPVPESQRRRPGPKRKRVPVWAEAAVLKMATGNPWYGHKRIAVMCRRAGDKVTNRQAYRVMKDHGLLQRRKPRAAQLYQAARLWELLPQRPDGLWQMDVTYVHIPGHGWWYAITVIDYYSRYLLCARLTASYSAAEATEALKEARAEAERLHGPLTKAPFLVTDNGSSFIARRFRDFVAEEFVHVRIQYRTPTQLGLLERFHRTLKEEEIYWRLYESPVHARECIAEFRVRYNETRPHWALIPEEGGDPVTPQDVYEHGVAVQIPKWQGWAKKAKAQLDKMMQEAVA